MWAYPVKMVVEAEGSHLCSSKEPMREERMAKDRAGLGRERGITFPSLLRSETNTISRIATVSWGSGVSIFFRRECIRVLDKNLK